MRRFIRRSGAASRSLRPHATRRHLPVVVRVIPSVGRHNFLLGGLQVSERPSGMSTKLDPSVRGLGLMNVLHRHFRRAICIPEIGMMDFISQSDCCYENRAQRSNDDLFHDLPLQLMIDAAFLRREIGPGKSHTYT